MLHGVQTLQAQLTQFKVSWAWSEKELFHCAIGNPSQLINKLKLGEYEPNVTEGARRSAIARMKTTTKHQKKLLEELQHDTESLCYFDLNLQPDDIPSIEVGRVPVVGFDDGAETKVKEKLRVICEDLLKALETR